jgi:Gluconate 2-dehydrogenase subunit 3
MERKPDTTDLDRRRALKQISLVFGAVSALPLLNGLSPEALLAQGRDIHQHAASGSAAAVVGTSEARLFFNPHQFETVDVICEILIPQTKTPGARAAKVPQFIDVLLAERETQMQEEIVAGLKWLDQRSRELFGKDFIKASPEQQVELFTRISSPDSAEASLGQVFFDRIKSLTVFGYYTSKEGLEEELGYAGPMGIGTYEGSVPLERG